MSPRQLRNPAPRSPIPWIATYILTALVLVAGAFFAVWHLERSTSEFDYDDADVAFLEKIVLSTAPTNGDFRALNGGDWQALCLVGWQGKPKEALNDAGIAEETAQALLRVYEDAEPDIKPSEFVLLYADRAGGTKAVHHPHGFAFAHEGAARCTTVAVPILRLPVRP